VFHFLLVDWLIINLFETVTIDDSEQTQTYVDFGDKYINDTADHRDEVEHVPRVFEIVLRDRQKHIRIFKKNEERKRPYL